jgi:D-alanyl-lipoteichoic acid acyltransferase DltB (MBOAT superfamily)
VQFNSVLYVWFGVLVFAISWALVRFPVTRLTFLLMASTTFYASWSAPYLVLILGGAGLDYVVGGQLARTEHPGRRRLWLLVSLGFNLGTLLVFKYAGFFLRSARDLVDVVAGDGAGRFVPVVELVVPAGISFFTFQTLSYTIDIYRRTLRPAASFLEFALYVAFFPQLVAGPIVRAKDFLPQLRTVPRYDPAQHGRGLWLLGVGLMKKVVIADHLGRNLVDRVFEDPSTFTGLEALLGCYGYALQIYGDFAGYSDMAIGSAALLGYTLPENFHRPYAAASLQEFWRRWHITLSTWLRDYLYIPLGGNRHGAFRTATNLVVTMLLGGLWHGAAWTFVLWGALHGAGLVVERAWQHARRSLRPHRETGPVGHVFAVVATAHFAIFAFVFFRAPDVTTAFAVLARIGEGPLAAPNIATDVIAILVVGWVLHATPVRWRDRVAAAYVAAPAVAQGLLLGVVAVAVAALVGTGPRPFIYFQF